MLFHSNLRQISKYCYCAICSPERFLCAILYAFYNCGLTRPFLCRYPDFFAFLKLKRYPTKVRWNATSWIRDGSSETRNQLKFRSEAGQVTGVRRRNRGRSKSRKSSKSRRPQSISPPRDRGEGAGLSWHKLFVVGINLCCLLTKALQK